MKKAFIFCLLIIGASYLSSCDKYNDGITDPKTYSNVYMPQASRSFNTSVTQHDTTYNFIYSAYLGGILDNNSDIQVTFGVDENAVDSFNAANGTNYRLLPSSNYILSKNSADIPAGSRTTDSLTLSVTTNGNLSLFKNYVLPIKIISISGGNAKILENKSIAFYTFKVGTQLALSLGPDWGGILSVGPKRTVITNMASNFDILMFLPDQQGYYHAPPLHIGINWGASESFYYVNENAMVVRNVPPYSGLFNFIMNPDNIVQNNTTPWNGIIYGAPNFWLGDQWNQWILAPYNNYFMTQDAGGILWRQPAFNFGIDGKVQVATNYNYTQILSYPSMNPNSLLCIDANGDLWYIPMSPVALPGTPKKVGSGWNIFKKIIVVGNDILALNSTNDLYRIEFTPDSFINLE